MSFVKVVACLLLSILELNTAPRLLGDSVFMNHLNKPVIGA